MTSARAWGSRWKSRSVATAPPPPSSQKPRVSVLDYSALTDATRQAQQAQFDMVFMANGHLIGTSAQAAHCTAVKAINPNCTLFQYVKISETNTGTDQADIGTKVSAQTWYLKTSGGANVHNFSSASGDNDINWLDYAAVDGSGYHYIDWKAIRDRWTLDAGNCEIFNDNWAWKSRADADWRLLGSNQVSGDATIAQAFRDVLKRYRALIVAYRAGTKFVVNHDTSRTTIHPDYAGGLIDYFYLEAVIGESWSIDTWSGFAGLLSLYDDGVTQAAQAHGCIINVHGPAFGAAGNFDQMRYGLGVTLLGNGIYNYRNQDYSQPPQWYDEYSYALGDPLAARVVVNVDKYKRLYTNGIVLVNPTGSSYTFDLTGQGYRRLGASDFGGSVQDGSVNTGAAVSTIAIGSKNAIILAKP